MKARRLLFSILLVAVFTLCFSSVASADCYVWLVGESCDLDRAFWDTTNYGDLNLRTDTLWADVLEREIPQDTTTNCYDHIIEGTHHTLTCDRISSKNQDLTFKTYFRGKVSNYKITEITKKEVTKILKKYVRTEEYECINETSKSNICMRDVFVDNPVTYVETTITPLDTKIENMNDWDLKSIRSFKTGEKRTYKIEWDDSSPTTILNVMRGTIEKGVASFPIVYYFSNEWRINPIGSYNSTSNNWGGTASGTELDSDNNITAIETPGSSSTGLTIGNNIGMDETPENYNRIPDLNWGGGTTYSYGQNFTANYTGTIAALEVVVRRNPDRCSAAGEDLHIDIVRGDTWETRTEVLANCEIPNADLSTDWHLYNCSSWNTTIPTLTSGNMYWMLFWEEGAEDCDGVGRANSHITDGIDSGAASTTFTSNQRSIYFNLYQNISAASSYTAIGNRTLDGFCPNYPDQYTWNNANFTEVDNDASNYAGLTVKFSNDNSTWSSETPYQDIDGTQQYACIQLIPNVTTDTTTTPRISQVQIDYESTIPPDVYITDPTNTTYYSTSADLNISSYDADGVDTLWYSNNSGAENNSISYPDNATLNFGVQGSYTIDVWVNDTSGLENSSSVTFYVNLPPTTPTPLAPTNYTNSSSIPSLVVSNSVDTETPSYYFEVSSDASFSTLDFSSSAVTEGTTNTSWTPTGLTEGSWYWRSLATDGYGNSSYTTPLYFTYDATPPAIYLDSPTNTTYYTTGIDLNYSVIDTNPTSVWYDFGSGNTSITGNSSVTFSAGSNNLYLYVNDSAGNTNSTAITFFINLINVNSSYVSPVIESQPQQIYLNVSATAINALNGTLFYNGTTISSTASYNDTSGYLIADFTTPSTNMSYEAPFFWNYTLNGVDYTTNLYNQSIYFMVPMNVSLSCVNGYSPAMCFDFADENNLTKHTANIDYNFQFGAFDNPNYKETYGSFTDAESFCLCVNSTFYNNYTLGFGEIQYARSGYADRRFYTFSTQRLSDQCINNTLYSLLSGSATSFLFDFSSTSLAPYVGKYSTLLRWYPNLNEYIVVEMGKTDDKGQTIMRVDTEDVDYRVGLYQTDGSLIKLLNPVRFACLSSPCTYSTQISEGDSDYTSIFDVEADIIYDEATELWTYIWNDPTQNTDSMRFVVTRERGDGSYTICDTSASGFTGVLTCDSTGFTGTLVGKAYRTASPETPILTEIINTISTPFRTPTGLLISFVAFVMLFLTGLFSPIIAIILGVVGLILAVKLGVISLAMFIAIGALGGIVLHFIKRT